VTELQQLRLQVRALVARVTALEAVQATVNGHPKQNTGSAAQVPRPRYVTIPQARSDERHNLWSEYFFLKKAEVTGRIYDRRRGQHPPTSKTWFAEHIRVNGGERLSTREFQRWFQTNNTFPEDSTQDRRIRSAVENEIARLRAAGHRIGRVSHGTA
jgi:hypothetical protein